MGEISPHKKKESKRNITSAATYMKKESRATKRNFESVRFTELVVVAGWGVLA
jgi:hypothetical protein